MARARAPAKGALDAMTGYVSKTLAADEEIIYRANFNWTYSFGPVTWFIVGIAPAALFFFTQFAAEVPFDELEVGWWFAGGAAACGSLLLLNHLIHLWTTEIVVTTFRFVYKKGLIARSTQEVSLNKIEEITLMQSVWGRIFGYGQLILRGTGVGKIELPAIDQPIRVRQVIENAKSRLRRGPMPDDDES